jgi:hypothetical protein
MQFKVPVPVVWNAFLVIRTLQGVALFACRMGKE